MLEQAINCCDKKPANNASGLASSRLFSLVDLAPLLVFLSLATYFPRHDLFALDQGIGRALNQCVAEVDAIKDFDLPAEVATETDGFEIQATVLLDRGNAWHFLADDKDVGRHDQGVNATAQADSHFDLGTRQQLAIRIRQNEINLARAVDGVDRSGYVLDASCKLLAQVFGNFVAD